MKKKLFTLVFSMFIFCIFTSVTSLWALPVSNAANDGYEDLLDGTIYSEYQNSGEFMFIQDGNNKESELTDLEIIVIQWLASNYSTYNTTGFTLTISVDSGDFTEPAALSGEYNVSSLYPNGVEFYAVKASTYFAMYYEAGGNTNGSWSTYDFRANDHPV